MEPCLTYGPSELMLLDDDVTRQLKDLDEGTLTYLAESRTALRAGGVAPGYPNMTILQVNSRPEPGDEWLLRCRVQGLMAASRRRTFRKFTPNLEGLDEGSETWLTRSSSSFSLGEAADGYSNMICVSCSSEELFSGWRKWDLSFRGIMGSKPYKRRISVDGQTVQPGVPITVTALEGGWDDPAKGRVDLPEVVVEDSSVVTVVPDTATVPSGDTPPDPPAIRSITIFGPDLTKQWPNGWSLLAISFDPIPGTSVGVQVKRWKYKWPATF